MSQKANPTLIGAFVLGSVVLVVGGLVLFGGGRFFTEKVTFVAFFDESISGLSNGAPVNFRGVKVGEVSDIQVHVSPDDSAVLIPIYLQLQRRRIREVDGATPQADMIEKLIDRGLRAQLEMQSIVTGQLQIQLDFQPERPPNYVNATSEFPEMPTIQSSLAELTETIESLSLEELVSNAQQVLAGLNRFINSPELSGLVDGINQAIQDLQSLVTTANQQIDPLVARVDGTLDEADQTLRRMRKTFDEADTTLRSVQHTFADARDVLGTADDSLSIASEDSPLHYELRQTLEEMSAAARSVRVLAEYLERNPDALLRGKSGE